MQVSGFVRSLLFIILLAMVFLSCRDEGIDSNPSVKLEFSTDSLLFDTVFTTVGSSTRSFKVYNNHHKRISISSISLARGPQSYFRINVDGSSGTTLRDIEIDARDSIFIFVEVTIDPVNQQLPLIILDSVVFNTNSNIQDVKLAAWGQDAHFIYPNYEDPESGFQFHLITENSTWVNDLPYVIYGLAIVAPDITLNIEEGTHVHFHNNSSLIFLERSTLKANGSADHPIYFQGDRLESFFKDVAGQWGRIWFFATSKDHEINYAIIKNGTVGLHVDTIGSTTAPTLMIRNTVIKNMSIAGLFAQGSHVVAENLIINDCGEHAAVLALGGTYDFRHCTFANYHSVNNRRTPTLVLNNYYEDIEGKIQIRELENFNISNSIIYGGLQEEITFDFYPGTNPSYTFNHCLIRTQLENSTPQFINVLRNQNPQFRNTQQGDYRLQENSPAIGAGSAAVSATVPFDILGNDRSQRSDLGAIQYYEVEEEDGI
jgi:hypothetical protein